MIAKPLLDVGDADWGIVQRILQQHVPEHEVWAFGSRAKWTAKEFSDLDLAVIGIEPLSMETAAALADDFSESDLPWKVDVVDWATTSESFRKIIERDRVVVQSASKGKTVGWGMSSEWPPASLREFVDLLAGFAFKSIGYTNVSQDVRLLRGDNIAPGKVRWESVKRWPKDGGTDLFKYVLEPGDVVLAMDRPWIPAGLKVAQVTKTDTPSYLVQRVARLRASSRSDCDFLFALLSTPDFESYIQNATTGTAVPHISAKQILDYEFRLPPAAARAAIGTLVTAVNNRITLLRETNTTLEAIAQALFKSWFVDFDPVRAKMEGRAPDGMDEATAALFPDSFEETELGVVPRGWQWGTLSDFATFQNGYAFKSKDWTDTGHPVIKIGDVKPGIIDLASCSYVSQQTVVGLERFMLKRGDLLVGMTGYVGETSLVPATEPAAYLNQRVGRIATKLGGGCSDLGYVYCIARSAAFKDFAETQSHGSAQANVSGASLMAYSAVLAPLTLIEVFSSAIAGMLEAILSNHEQAQTLSTLRDTLLPRLISGCSRLSMAALKEIF